MFLIKIAPGMDNDSFSMILLLCPPEGGDGTAWSMQPKRAAIFGNRDIS
jgi:hypothetical protein